MPVPWEILLGIAWFFWLQHPKVSHRVQELCVWELLCLLKTETALLEGLGSQARPGSENQPCPNWDRAKGDTARAAAPAFPQTGGGILRLCGTGSAD